MAEAFAIIGLASSVVAFVDFSLKLIAAAKSARDSIHDTLPQLHEIDLVLQDVHFSNLKAKQMALQDGPLSEAEQHIMTMATECERLGGELRAVIDKLKINPDTKFRAIQSTRLAFQKMRREKDIGELQDRIRRLDERIRTNVQMLLDRKNSSDTLSKLSTLIKSQDDLGIKHDSKLDSIQKDILRLVASEQAREGQLAASKDHLDSLARESAICRKQYRVIKSLYFDELPRRWSDIASADKFTNDWLFDSTRTSFLTWLESGNGIYWISGKAGSGKSTLIKFAAKHDQTVAALNEWAGPAQLHIASFYFWNQGFDMQKSQIGLFQSLLYQILRRAPELVPHVYSDDRLDHERWEFDDLKKAFESLATHSGLSTKYCFFIDGLDEYNGEEQDVLSFLSYFADSKVADIKICVSTRPRRMFEPFQQSDNSLIVQDFTEEDMKRHVRVGLQMNDNFKHLPKSDSEELVAEISQQSKGVWLWVYLVTRDLVHAVNHDEGLDTLKKILRQFPPDLDEYFSHIIERIKHVHRVETAQIFLITLQEVQPLPLFLFSMLDRETHSPNYAVEALIEPLDAEELSETERVWKARIQNRCSDLLVVSDTSHPIFLRYPVDFLHRTVRDFLQDSYYPKLRQLVAPRPDFDPLVSLCRMTLFASKSVPKENFRLKSSLNRIIGLTDELLYYAHEIEKRSTEPDTAPSPVADILDELDRVNCKHASKSGDKHWTHARDLPRTRGYEEYREGGNCNFLALTIQARLTRYVRAKLSANPELLEKKAGRPLLDLTLRPRRVTAISMPYHSQREDPRIAISVIRLLLERKANPNQEVHLNDDRTVWALFLLSCYESDMSGEATVAMKKSWYKASALLCQHGADPQPRLDKTNPSFTARQILLKLFGDDQTLQLEDLAAKYREQEAAKEGPWSFLNPKWWLSRK